MRLSRNSLTGAVIDFGWEIENDTKMHSNTTMFFTNVPFTVKKCGYTEVFNKNDTTRQSYEHRCVFVTQASQNVSQFKNTKKSVKMPMSISITDICSF